MKFFLKTNSNDSRSEVKEYRAQFWVAGLANYSDSGMGVALLKKETMDKMLPSFIGCPVVIQHKDGSAEEILASGQAVGKITDAFFNPETGWYDCKFTVESEEARARIKDGWSVSCAFDSDDTGAGGDWVANHYDFEIVDGHFTHLALVPNPRYEDSKIFANQKCFINSKEASMIKQNGTKKEQVYKELTELGKLGTLGKDYHKYFRRLEATDVDKEFQGMSVSDIADQIVMLEGGAQNSKENEWTSIQFEKDENGEEFFIDSTGRKVMKKNLRNPEKVAMESLKKTNPELYAHRMRNSEVKCRYCGRPSEDRSGVCDACERKYENSEEERYGVVKDYTKLIDRDVISLAQRGFGKAIEEAKRRNVEWRGVKQNDDDGFTDVHRWVLATQKGQGDPEADKAAAELKKIGVAPSWSYDKPHKYVNDAFGPNIIRVTFRTKRGSTEDKYKRTEEFSSEANARLRASALNWDIISSEQIKQNAKVKLYMKTNAAGGFTNPPNIGDAEENSKENSVRMRIVRA